MTEIGNIGANLAPGALGNIDGRFTNYKMLHDPSCAVEPCTCLDLLEQGRLMEGQQNRPLEWIRQGLVDFVLHTGHKAVSGEDKEQAGILATLLKHEPILSGDFRKLLIMMETFPGPESSVFDADGLLEPICDVAIAMRRCSRSADEVIQYLYEGYLVREQLWLGNPNIVPHRSYPLDVDYFQEQFPCDPDAMRLAARSLMLYQPFIHPPWVSDVVRQKNVLGRFTQKEIAQLIGARGYKVQQYLKFLEEISIPHDLSVNRRYIVKVVHGDSDGVCDLMDLVERATPLGLREAEEAMDSEHQLIGHIISAETEEIASWLQKQYGAAYSCDIREAAPMLMKLLTVAVESLPDRQGDDEIGTRKNYRKLALVLIECISHIPPPISIGDFVLLFRKLAIRIASSSGGGCGDDGTIFGLDQQSLEDHIKLHLLEGELHSQTESANNYKDLWIKAEDDGLEAELKAFGDLRKADDECMEANRENADLRRQNEELRDQVSNASRLELDSQRVRLLYALVKLRLESSNQPAKPVIQRVTSFIGHLAGLHGD